MSDQEGPDARIQHDTGGEDWIRGGLRSGHPTDDTWVEGAMTGSIEEFNEAVEQSPSIALADILSAVYLRAYDNLAGDEEGDDDHTVSGDYAAAGAGQVVRGVATIMATPEPQAPQEQAAPLLAQPYADSGSFLVELPNNLGRVFLHPGDDGAMRVTWLVRRGNRTRQDSTTLNPGP